jgi:hypothetical protein
MVEQQPIRTCRDCVFCHSKQGLNNNSGGNVVETIDSCKLETPKGKRLKSIRPCNKFTSEDELARRFSEEYLDKLTKLREKTKLNPEEQLMWEILTEAVKNDE